MQRHHWMSGLLLLVLAGAFSEVGRLDFVLWDDDVNVYENPYLHPVTLRNVLWFWRQPYFSMYIPVTRTVWAGLGLVSGLTSEGPGIKPMDPSVFHLANLAVHALNALLVFTLLRKLVANDWACCAGALLFGLHPVQVEPVAWVTGMKDLLGGLFALVALWGYLTHAMRRREGGGAAAGRAHYVVATVAFALALLSKPSAVVLPVVAWVLDRWALKRPAREVVWALAPWVVLAIAAGGVAAWAEAAIRGARTYTPIWARPFVAGDALAFYLYKLLVPLRLGSDYGRTPQFVLGHAWGYLTWLAPCVLGVLLWARRQAWPLSSSPSCCCRTGAPG